MPRINYVSVNNATGQVQPVGQLLAEASDYGYVEIGSDNLNQPGSFPFRVDQAGNVKAGQVSSGGTPLPSLVASAYGVALINGTQNFTSWTAPNDGQIHRVEVITNVVIGAVAETGGACNTSITSPDGSTHNPGSVGGGAAANSLQTVIQGLFVKAGTTVTPAQSSALTAGGPVLAYVEIWAS